MPTLPLPVGGSSIDGGDLPVVDQSDIEAVMPAFVQASDSAPVRDAIAAGLTAILLQYQSLSSETSGQCDITRAVGVYLQGLAADRGIYKQAGETDEQLRARVLTIPAFVTPQAILAAANTILGPLTTVQCQYLESVLDRWFVTNGPHLTGPQNQFHSFVGAGPNYPDRLYPDDVGTAGRLQSNPGGAWTFGDSLGRYFVLRVPVIEPGDVALVFNGQPLQAGELPAELQPNPATTGALGIDQLPPTSGGAGLYIGDGSNTSGAEADGSVATFIFSGITAPVTAYQGIVNAVERIKGQSVRWQLFVDSNLS